MITLFVTTTRYLSDVRSVSCCFPDTVSVPSPSSDTSVPMVTPARSLLRNTPASLFRQTGRTDYMTIKLFRIWSRQHVYLMSLLSRSNSQSSRCFLHFGVRSSDTSICAHAPKCFERSGEKRTREETSSTCFC